MAASRARLRSFVRRHTTLAPVLDLPGVRLHVAEDVMALCALAGRELGQSDPPLPFWAFPWAGGLGVARYLAEHPQEAAGRRVVDLATGSGLCAIVAARLGAASVEAVDVDPLAVAAAELNAAANGVRLAVAEGDPLDGPPPECDLILAGDVCYEETMARRMVAWLLEASAAGTRVLLGDPGRRYLPAGLERLATYEVRTSRELEDAERKSVAVYVLSAGSPAHRGNAVVGASPAR